MRKAAEQLANDPSIFSIGGHTAADVLSRARELVGSVVDETVNHPFRTVGVAASAGFVLGGGLFTPLTARTLRAGIHLALRFAVLPTLTKGLVVMGARLFDDSEAFQSTTHAEGERS